MAKNQYELCLEVLRRFNKAGILDSLIIIGSWCVYFYKEYFPGGDYLSTIRTRDMDLLIPLPPRFHKKVDIPEMLKDLGFITDFKGEKGYMKLDHPELIVEFLVPERGRGEDKPYKLPSLGVNAQALRFLDILADNLIKIKVEGMEIRIPHPAAFALHKLIVQKRRSKSDKSEKDRKQAVMILEHLVNQKMGHEIRRVYRSLHKAWQKKISDSLHELKLKDISDLIAGT